MQQGVDASAGKVQIAVESGVEFLHVPIKNKTHWSVISGTLRRLELVAPGQTVILSEPWHRGEELRIISNDDEVDVPELLKGFGGGHHSIGGGHSEARLTEIIDLIRERWSKMKDQS